MSKGYVYCFKCLTNNLIYIGSTKDRLSIRRAKHIYDSKHQHRIKPVHRIILNNGGFNNFQMRILKEVDDLSILHLQEKKIIENYKNNNKFTLMNSYC